MRPPAPAAAMLLVAAALVSAIPASSVLAGPRLEVAERSIDFGVVAPNEVAAREISARNAGDAPLILGAPRILSEEARASALEDTLAPGAQTTVRVAILPTKPGAFETKIIFQTNDEAASAVILVLRAQVVPRYELDTSPRTLGLLRPGGASDAEIRIRFRGGLGARLEGVAATPAFVRLTRGPGSDSLEALVKMALAKNAPRGVFVGDVALFVAIPHPDTLHVQIRGEVTGRWRASPTPLVISRTKRSGRYIPSLLFERTVEKAARVTAASTDIPNYKTVVETVTEGRSYRVRLLPAAGWAVGEWKGSIRIETDDPEERVVSVPARVFVAVTPP